MRGNFVTDRTGDKNPNYKHGRRHTRLFRIWSNIKTRCSNKNTTYYQRYGGRGIIVCDEWKNDFKAFYDWAMANGYADGLTIDRINNDGNYCPENCRWVTMSKQSRNKSTNHLFTAFGVTKSLIELCEFHQKNYKTVRDRLRRGWNIERALTEEIQIKFRKGV